jgi:hypothetical protein
LPMNNNLTFFASWDEINFKTSIKAQLHNSLFGPWSHILNRIFFLFF